VKPGGVVTVSVPAETLYNFEKMTALNKSVLGRLGCPNCHSGLNINFLLHEQEFGI
jgi:hypothetical protein